MSFVPIRCTKINIPILHIADATAAAIKQREICSVGLLGTKYTMEQEFYRSRLELNGIRVIVPDNRDREIVNKIIYEELCIGKVLQTSREYYKQVMKRLMENGAEGIILGCTEIGLLVKQEDSDVPVFDTTALHAIEAVNQSLNK